jgi:hypothetical protein
MCSYNYGFSHQHWLCFVHPLVPEILNYRKLPGEPVDKANCIDEEEKHKLICLTFEV